MILALPHAATRRGFAITTTRPELTLKKLVFEEGNYPESLQHSDIENRLFRVVHPYHPLFQQEFEAVNYRQNWGEDRVWFHDKNGRLHSVPTAWTDAAAVDPFVVVAAGRSLFRVVDLLELSQRMQAVKPEEAESRVKEKMSSL